MVTLLGFTMSIWWAIFYVVLGGVVVLAAIGGGVLLLAKLIFDETERVRKAQAKWDAKTKHLQEHTQAEMVDHNRQIPLYKPTDYKAHYVSSAELKVGDIVYLRSGQWRVYEKLDTALGMLIRLQSVTRPNHFSPNRIKRENIYDKVWNLRPPDWKG